MGGQSAQRMYNKKEWKKKLKALEKTKQVIETKNAEKYLMERQKEKMKEFKVKQKQSYKAAKEKRRKQRIEKQKQDDLRSYKGMFDEDNMTSNRNMTEDYEDNFM